MLQLDDSEKRLILLYILNKLNTTVSNEKLSKIVVNTVPIDWFDIQLILKSLINDNLIRQIDNRIEITSTGKDTVNHLNQEILFSIKDSINNYISKNYSNLTSEAEIIANFKKRDGGFEVFLSLKEMNEDLLELKLQVPTRELAEKICMNFKKETPSVYHKIIETLI